MQCSKSFSAFVYDLSFLYALARLKYELKYAGSISMARLKSVTALQVGFLLYPFDAAIMIGFENDGAARPIRVMSINYVKVLDCLAILSLQAVDKSPLKVTKTKKEVIF